MKEKLKKYMYIILICIVCCFILVCVLFSYSEDEIKLNNKSSYSDLVVEDDNNGILEIEEENISYYVDIKGEVVKPGVYEVNSNSRIIDVINKAGGLTKNADTSLINLSKKVIDEMNIKIYSKKEVSSAKESIKKEPEVIEIIKEIEKECVCPEVNNTCDNKNDAVIESEIKNDKEETEDKIVNNKLININTATKEELMTLSSIGEAKAKCIIEYREKNKFNKIEDILNVSGIGEALFDKIKEYITV